jgi:hypothetical protein
LVVAGSPGAFRHVAHRDVAYFGPSGGRISLCKPREVPPAAPFSYS